MTKRKPSIPVVGGGGRKGKNIPSSMERIVKVMNKVGGGRGEMRESKSH